MDIKVKKIEESLFVIRSIPFEIEVNGQDYHGVVIEEITTDPLYGFEDYSYKIEWDDVLPKGVKDDEIINIVIEAYYAGKVK